MEHIETKNFEGSVQFDLINEGQGIKRRVAYLRFDDIFTLPSHTCTVVKIIDNNYKLDRNNNNCMEIYDNVNQCEAYYVAKTLIDEDYFDYTFVTVFNPHNADVCVNMIKFKISSYYYQPEEVNIHTFPLFYIDEEDLDSDIPSICGFAHQTNGANGLDVICNRKYIINPLEILDVPCKFYFYTSTLDFQDLFIMRSRFARMGITCHYDAVLRKLRIINHNNRLVDLGNRFFQIVLPTPICFRVREFLQKEGHPIFNTQFDMVTSANPLIVEHCAPEKGTIKFKDADRKAKFSS